MTDPSSSSSRSPLPSMQFVNPTAPHVPPPPPPPLLSRGAAATNTVGTAALESYSNLPIQDRPVGPGSGVQQSSKVTVKEVIRYVEAPVFGRSITLRLEIPAGSAVHTEEDVRLGQTRALLTACVSDNADVANAARTELGRLYEFLVLDALERHPDFRRAAEEATHHLTKEQKLGYLLAHTLLLPDGTILLKKPSRPPTPAAPEGVPAEEVPVPAAPDTAKIGEWPNPRPATIDLPANHILTVCRDQWKALPMLRLTPQERDAPEVLLTAWRKFMATINVDRRHAGLGLGGRGDESITGIFNKIFRGLGPAPATMSFTDAPPDPNATDAVGPSGASFGFSRDLGPSVGFALRDEVDVFPPSPSSSSGSDTLYSPIVVSPKADSHSGPPPQGRHRSNSI